MKHSTSKLAPALAVVAALATGVSYAQSSPGGAGGSAGTGSTAGATAGGTTGAAGGGAAMGARSSSSAMNRGGDKSLSHADKKFVDEAAMAGMAEVQAAQLALQKGSSDDVKQYAQHMIDDHTKANDQLKQIAQQKGVQLPTEMDRHHKSEMNKLNKLSGAEFDKAYLKGEVGDHKKVVSLFEKEAKNGKDADLKQFASQTVPTLQDHLKSAQSKTSSNKSASSDKRGVHIIKNAGAATMDEETTSGAQSRRLPTARGESGDTMSSGQGASSSAMGGGAGRSAQGSSYGTGTMSSTPGASTGGSTANSTMGAGVNGRADATTPTPGATTNGASANSGTGVGSSASSSGMGSGTGTGGAAGGTDSASR